MTANRFNFRFWDKKNNYMFMQSCNNQDFEHILIEDGEVILANALKHESGYELAVAPKDRYILMQSTGMVDKNNKEIFEGDLIRDENNDLFILQFNTAYDIQTINQIESWTTNLSIEDEETDFDMINHKIMWYKDYINKKVEVIGNIYENKELLRE